MVDPIVMQLSFGPALATVGTVVTALLLWTVLWLANTYENKMANNR